MAIHFTKLACPSVITSVGSFLIFTINTIFAGKFEQDSAAKLAGVGLGSMVLSMVIRYTITGMNCAQETLVPEAYGQGQLLLAGVYLNRGFFIMSLVFTPLAVLLCFSETALR